jgi:Cft2 family RNA processing exonuclease
MRLSFRGADRDMTGHCYWVEVNGLRILIDCAPACCSGGRPKR